ncbi:hypothetical protein MMC20_004864 [Loxospora ochrophaea]|nr:hypothetical protein [Loxospora ochrophaea]
MADVRISHSLVIAASAIWPPICLTTVGLRFYTRRVNSVTLGLDDWLTIPAVILLTGMAVSALGGVAFHSVGYPTPPPPNPSDPLNSVSYEQQTTRKALWAIELMQIPALGCTKLSFLFFYRRIFRQGKGKIFDVLTITRPSSYWGSLADNAEYCVPISVLQNAYAISDFLLDVIIISFPMPLIWHLHMNMQRKVGLIGVFALGFFTVGASITRMVIYIQSLQVEFSPQTDIDFLLTGANYWSILEAGVGLTSACLPTLYSIFSNWTIKGTARNFSKDSTSQGLHHSSQIEKRNTNAPTASHDGILMSTDITLSSSPIAGPGKDERGTSEDMEMDLFERHKVNAEGPHDV